MGNPARVGFAGGGVSGGIARLAAPDFGEVGVEFRDPYVEGEAATGELEGSLTAFGVAEIESRAFHEGRLAGTGVTLHDELTGLQGRFQQLLFAFSRQTGMRLASVKRYVDLRNGKAGSFRGSGINGAELNLSHFLTQTLKVSGGLLHHGGVGQGRNINTFGQQNFQRTGNRWYNPVLLCDGSPQLLVARFRLGRKIVPSLQLVGNIVLGSTFEQHGQTFFVFPSSLVHVIENPIRFRFTSVADTRGRFAVEYLAESCGADDENEIRRAQLGVRPLWPMGKFILHVLVDFGYGTVVAQAMA